MENLIIEIEKLEQYNVPTDVICKLIVGVYKLDKANVELLRIYKDKICSLLAKEIKQT